MILRFLGLGVLVSWSSASLRAHEYWLEPERAPAGRIAIRLMLGEGFGQGQEKATQRRRVAALRLITLQTETDLLPLLGEKAKPLLELDEHQLTDGVLLALERTPARITLDHVKFNAYLRQEGMVKAILQRTHAREMGRAGRERYTRYLKLFLPGEKSRDRAKDPSTRVLGHPLEIVPEAGLGALRKGGRLAVRVIFENAPLPEAEVVLIRRPRRGEIQRRTERTDADGRAIFKVAGAGLHALRFVHIRRVLEVDPTDFSQPEWESYWSSYVFPVRGR